MKYSYPTSFTRVVSLTPRKGFILFGPAGTGKTRLAVKTCDALGIPEKQRFFIRSAEVISKSPNASTKKLDEYFKPAVDAYERKGHKAETYVYVFDELDAMLYAEYSAMADQSQKAVRTFLQSIMDGEKAIHNIIIIGTTNVSPSKFAPALIRAGRFQLHIEMDLPEKGSRFAILSEKLKELSETGWNVSGVDVEALANSTEGLSIADLIAVLSAAITIASSSPNYHFDTKKVLTHAHFMRALHNPHEIKNIKNKMLKSIRPVYDFRRTRYQKIKVFEQAQQAMARIRGECGRFGIILIEGATGTGKSAVCHELLKEAEGYDHYCVLTRATGDYDLLKGLMTALEQVRKSEQTLIMVDDLVPAVFADDDNKARLTSIENTWKSLTGHLSGKSVTLVVTTTMSASEFCRSLHVGFTPIDHIRLESGLSLNDMEHILEEQGCSPAVQSRVADAFPPGCPPKQFFTLLHHYRIDSPGNGEVDFDTEGIKAQFSRRVTQMDYYN